MLSKESLALSEYKNMPNVGRGFAKLQVLGYHLHGQSHDPACCSRLCCAGGISERFLCSLCAFSGLESKARRLLSQVFFSCHRQTWSLRAATGPELKSSAEKQS